MTLALVPSAPRDVRALSRFGDAVQVYAPGWMAKLPWFCAVCRRTLAHEYAWKLAFGGIVCDYCRTDAERMVKDAASHRSA